MIITEAIRPHISNGRVTLGYCVTRSGEPVFIGTWGECSRYGSETLGIHVAWTIKDARRLEVGDLPALPVVQLAIAPDASIVSEPVQAPEERHEAVRLFEPAPTQIAGQQGMML